MPLPTRPIVLAVWLAFAVLSCAVARAQDVAESNEAPPERAPNSPDTAPEATATPQLRAADSVSVHAPPEPEPEPEPEPDITHRGPWPIAAAVVLGPIVHGAGHFAAGESKIALRLLAAEGIGILAAVGGLGGLALTGASEKTVVPLAALMTFGVGLFATSMLADVYGVIAPRDGFGTAVLRPALTAEAGLFGVSDPIFHYDALTYVAGRAFVARHSLSLQGHFGIDHDNQRVRGMYAYRFVEHDAASYLDVELGAVHHRYAPEQFSMTFAEVAVRGQLALQHFARTLRGAFVEGAFGLAFGGHRYFDIATESDSMLLLRVGFGFFIGDGGSWELYYDHRHDGYAGGLKLPGLASGVLGHIGTALQYYLTAQWGLAVRAETGSAHVLGLSLLFRRKRW